MVAEYTVYQRIEFVLHKLRQQRPAMSPDQNVFNGINFGQVGDAMVQQQFQVLVALIHEHLAELSDPGHVATRAVAASPKRAVG